SPEPDAPAGEAPAPEEAPPALSDAERKAKGREHFQKGITLIKERAWSEALAEFLASRELYPTRVATTNAAIAYRELRRFDESLAMYETLMREYGDMPAAEMEEVKKAVTELRGRVGSIDIDLTEPGATIVIDDVTRGTYPPPGPLRVSAGSHIIRVVKEGYEPFETTVDVAGGNAARVSAPLTKLTESGQLSVTETKGRTLVVLVDDVEVGQTPWSGRLSIGQHSVRLRGEDKLGTPPVAAPVKSQETTSLSLEASPLTAQLRIEPTPANAEVFIDAVTVGRGIWEGAMTAGPHQIEVREPGFLPASRKVELGDDQKEVLAIQLERAEEGITIPGDFTVDVAAVGMLAPNFGGDVIGDCGDGCDRAIGLGFMARLHLGYEFPFGLGLGVFGGYLVTSQEVAGRSTTVQPVGLESRAGTAADTVRLRGPLVGAFGSYLFDGELPVMLRLGAGPVFAQLRDARTGSFELDDGNTYQAGPIIQEPTAIYLGIFPEVRGGYRFNEWFTFTVGVEVPLLVALKRPSWDPAREIDAAVDGIGAYETEALTGRVVAAVALSLGGRVQF
ncbi:MAG: PEGA domain-containing protein, partial [Myxococcales bacterium]|nr:PEGA domain-containing protein [Myxococcales bacterium]